MRGSLLHLSCAEMVTSPVSVVLESAGVCPCRACRRLCVYMCCRLERRHDIHSTTRTTQITARRSVDWAHRGPVSSSSEPSAMQCLRVSSCMPCEDVLFCRILNKWRSHGYSPSSHGSLSRILSTVDEFLPRLVFSERCSSMAASCLIWAHRGPDSAARLLSPCLPCLHLSRGARYSER